ncbi:quinone oxidoreductase family protein [Streptomyces acidicola]|uniref:quinone oxidoreductase family protein n=1 Tax=Streptomyces acidicola TaxID=2596892 RepID=UPI0037FA56CF
MRAALIHQWKSAPVFADLPEVTRSPGETLVRIEAATVSHLDVTVASGEFALSPDLPYVPGVEGAAVVVESEVFRPGQQVIFRDGGLGLSENGSWREYASVPDNVLVPLEITLPPSTAATFFTPVTTAYVALFDIGGLQPGQTVLVSGATGAVGSVALQLAGSAGCDVIALVSRRSRLARLPDGVQGVALDDEEALAKLREARPVDLYIDTIGGEGLSDRISWVKPGGRVACLGYTAGTTFSVDLPNWFFSDVAILPVNLLNKEARAQEVARELLPRIAKAEIGFDIEEFTIEQAAEAWEKLNSGQVTGRAVIRF